MIAWLHKHFSPLLLALCLIFLGFANPAYAASSEEPFVDGLKNGAGQAVGAAAVGSTFCLASVLFAPPLAPAVCVTAAETVAGWFGFKLATGN
jgi:hypothetical protein